ncbi:tyrosine-type recombinase/integrase [Pseudorhodoplanes sp.]|uniref:tyrosine-type recombinase/integrase n=1 Tax=Pseudorhodoplanes sp. TaxID=1934341 RepID=UPI003D0A3E65
MARVQKRERDPTFEKNGSKFTDPWVKATKPYEKEVQYLERLEHEQARSLILYVSPAPFGTKTWRALFYDPVTKRPKTQKLGRYPKMGVKEARNKAKAIDPRRAIAADKAGTFAAVAEKWFKQRVVARQLTSFKEIQRHLDSYILPALGAKKLFEITPSDIIDLRDDIKERKGTRKRAVKKPRKTKVAKAAPDVERKPWDGAPQADAVLATLRSIFKWAAVPYGFPSPMAGGDFRLDTREGDEKARSRWLKPHEVRALWQASDDFGVFGDMVKVLLLTGQRLRAVTTMRRDAIIERLEYEQRRDGKSVQFAFNNVWVLPEKKRKADKGTIGAVALPDMVVEIINRQPVIEDNPYVFPAMRGTGPIGSFSKSKRDLEARVKELLPDIEPWVLHDLRRTARTILAEEGVADHIAERTLGHKIKGVEGVYNRYPYLPEKSEALRILAGAVAATLSPANVANLADHAKKRAR